MVFILGMVVIIGLSDFFFAKTGYINYILRQSESKEVKYNEFVLGASHAKCSIDPVELEAVSNNTALNMAISGETIKDSYYLLQELNRTNDVDEIVLDVDYNYWFGNLGEGCFAEAFLYNQYSWKSPVKWKYLAENSQYLDFRNAMTKRFVYQYTASGIKANVKQKLSEDYKDANIYSLNVQDMGGQYAGKGFFAIDLPAGNPVGEDYVRKQMGIEKGVINPYPEKYFRKLVKYCKQHDIDLVCVTSPITPTSMQRLGVDVAYGKLTKMFNEMDVPYYDCNRLRFDVLSRKDTDYIDKEGHMGGELAHKYSKVLAKVLKEHRDGTLNESQYFYDSYEQMYKSMGGNKTK
jgi:hypothetical protein